MRDSRVAWSAVEAACSGLLSIVSVFVVARIAGPAAVGVGASAVAVHVMLWVLVNAIFADALVQAAALEAGAIRGARSASLGVGIAAAIVQVAAGPLLADLIGDSRLPWMCAALAWPLPLVGLGGVAQGLLTRERRYRALAARATVGQGAGTLIGVGAALAGGGAWAIVAQQATVSAIGALVLVRQARAGGAARADWPATRALLVVGTKLASGTLTQTSRYRLFALIVGGTAGPAALGQVHMAFRIVDTLRDLALTALWRLMLPPMSERQHDLASLQSSLDRFLSLIGLALFPLAGAMAVTLAPLTVLLLGPAWAASGEAASVLSLLLIYIFIGFPGGVANIARGRAGASLAAQVFGTTTVLAAALLWQPATPMAAVLAWMAAHAAAAPVACAVTAGAMRAGYVRHMRAGVPSLALVTLAGAAAVLVPRALGEPGSPWALIAARLAIGGAVYAAGVLLFLRAPLADALASAGLRQRGRPMPMATSRATNGTASETTPTVA